MFAVSATVFAQSFSFFPFDDKGNGGSSEIKMDSTMETIQGKEYPVSTITGKVTTKYQYGFIGVAVKPDPKMLELLKSAKGIKFKVIGDGRKYRVKVETSDITDFDHYGKEFATKKGEPVEITIPYPHSSRKAGERRRNLTSPRSSNSVSKRSASRFRR
jgi:hypothetical protein